MVNKNNLKYSKIVYNLIARETEEEWFEFKENWYEPHDIGKYISALSNAAAIHGRDNGYLVWGIADSTCDIVGTNFNPRANVKGEPLEHFLARQVTPDIAFSFHELEIAEKRIVVLEVPRARRVPTSFAKVRYARIGSSRVKLADYPERESALFEVLRGDEDSLETIPSAYQELTFDRLFTYYAGKGIVLERETFKKNLGLLTPDGDYNLLAQLVSDDSRISIRVSIFTGDTKVSPMHSVKEFGNTCLFLSLDKILEFADVLNLVQADERYRGLSRVDVDLFDMVAFREAIVNAFVHNKWSYLNGPAVTVFSDRIEILSRGSLPVHQTVEGFYRGESVPVNRHLSDMFLQLRISERVGRGVPRIVASCGRDVIDLNEESILVTIPFNRLHRQGAKGAAAGLNAVKERILLEMRNNPNVTQSQLMHIIGVGKTTVQNNVSYLRNNGYIERVGSPRNGYWEVL